MGSLCSSKYRGSVNLNSEQKELLEKFREIENDKSNQVKNSFKKPKVSGKTRLIYIVYLY